MNKITTKIKAAWERSSPKEKKVFVLAGVLAGLLCMLLLSYVLGGNKTIPAPKETAKKSTTPLDANLLEKSLYREKEQELRQRDEQMKALKAEIDELKKEKDSDRVKERSNRFYPPIPTSAPAGTALAYPPSPLPPPPSSPAVNQKQAEPELLGDIEIAVNNQPQARPVEGNDKANKKKDAEKIYLPPSFMPAVLLTGVRAKTSGEGKSDPQPILFRVTDLAVLPNRIKKDLKDCFFVANVIGDLSQERADVRLVSLHCLAKDGRVAIDQKVKGTVLDSDGVENLDGKVVARWGSSLAASAYAGAFSGLGDGMKAASSQTLVTASGTIQQIKPGDMLLGSAGSGVAGAFHKIADFMLDIARQTMPVVEVGNMKPVTIFITEGVDIEVKNYCSRLESLGGSTCRDDI